MAVCNFIFRYTKGELRYRVEVVKIYVREFSLSACNKCKFPDNTSRDFDSAVGPGFYLPGDSVGVKVGDITHLETLLQKMEIF